MNSEPTTTPIAFIVRSMELLRHAAQEVHYRLARRWLSYRWKSHCRGLFHTPVHA